MYFNISDTRHSRWWRDLCIICEVGTGQQNEEGFWEDNWMGEQLLKDKFRRLYSISSSKNSVVKNVGAWVINRSSGIRRWNLE